MTEKPLRPRKPEYCVYPAVKRCEECSLTNYGLDCCNNPISMPVQQRNKRLSLEAVIRSALDEAMKGR